MTRVRARLATLERALRPAAQSIPAGQVFDSVQRAIQLLELDLRERAASWTDEQRAALTALQAIPRESSRFADLSDDEFALLSQLARERFAVV